MADGKLIEGTVLVALVQEATTTGDKVSELNGALGNRIKHHVEHSNLNKGVFSLMRRLNRMDELRRDEWLANFDHCREEMQARLWDRDGHVGDLANMAGQSDEDEDRDEDAEAAEANEAALREGISQLPEDADDKPKKGERRRTKPKAGGTAPGSYKLN